MVDVSIAGCPTYVPERIAAALTQAMAPLGGIEQFVRPGQQVLIKPNLLKGASPDQAATTHPEVVRGVIRLARTVTERILVGDSPAGAVSAAAVYEQCGLPRICAEEGATLIRFDRVVHRDGVPLARARQEADVCINVPKFKTHGVTVISAGVKNMFGVVPGLFKVLCHKEAPQALVFADHIARIYGLVRPELTIVDAIVAMEGNGPACGTPRSVGAIVAAADAVAVDAVLAAMIGLSPRRVPTTMAAFQRGLGEARLEHITIHGLPLAAVRQRNFKQAPGSPLRYVPNSLARMLLKLVPLYMRVVRERCVQCGECVRICPQQAICFSGAAVAVNRRACILCLCCSESCPENAIDLCWRRLLS